MAARARNTAGAVIRLQGGGNETEEPLLCNDHATHREMTTMDRSTFRSASRSSLLALAGPALLALLSGGCIGVADDAEDDLAFRVVINEGGDEIGDDEAGDDEIGDDAAGDDAAGGGAAGGGAAGGVLWQPTVPVPSVDECIIVVSEPSGAPSSVDECPFNPAGPNPNFAPSSDSVWASSTAVALRMCENLGYQPYCEEVCGCGGEKYFITLTPVVDANDVPQMCILKDPNFGDFATNWYPCGCQCDNPATP